MEKLYIVDIIGTHCGMHYYDNALSDLLGRKYHVKVLSTFSSNDLMKGFFPNIFKHNKFVLLLLLVFCWIKYIVYRLTHKGIYIYLCYGELYDLPFLLSAFAGNVYIDIHEIHALKHKDDSLIAKTLKLIIGKFTKKVIYHSKRTAQILSEMHYDGRQIFVPHFNYNFPKQYVEDNIASDIKNTFTGNYHKFLFFGNLSRVKGVDVVIDSFMKLSNTNEMEVVIAGKNVEGINFNDMELKNNSIKFFPRHINDDELVYLYSHTDYVLLPYRKSSQSGILAMAAYFRKPMILSDIPYFKTIIEQYPSFGICGSIDDYHTLIEQIINMPYDNFYQSHDCEKYEFKAEYDIFVNSIC